MGATPLCLVRRARFVVTLLPLRPGASLYDLTSSGNWVSLRRFCPGELRALPTPWTWMIGGITFEGVPEVYSISTVLAQHLQAKNSTCQCVPPNIKLLRYQNKAKERSNWLVHLWSSRRHPKMISWSKVTNCHQLAVPATSGYLTLEIILESRSCRCQRHLRYTCF